MTADLSLIWRQGAWLPRFALLVAAGAAAAHLASLAGAGWQDLEPFGIGLHLAVMGLILAVVLRGWRDLFARSRSGDHKLVPFPRGLTRVCVGLVAYALVWFVALFATYGEGWYEVRDGQYLWINGGTVVRELSAADARWADARMLSVFSAAWLAFALPLAIVHYRHAVRKQAETDIGARSA